jgi:hypothetical protein
MRCNLNAILCLFYLFGSSMKKEKWIKKRGLIEIFLRCLLYMGQIYACIQIMIQYKRIFPIYFYNKLRKIMIRCMTPTCYLNSSDTSLLPRNSCSLSYINMYSTLLLIACSLYIYYLNKFHNKITFFMKIGQTNYSQFRLFNQGCRLLFISIIITKI